MIFAGALLAAALAFSSVQAAPVQAAPSPPLDQRVETHDNSKGEIEKRAGDFRHRSSNYLFPMTLGEMPARSSTTYGAADGSVYYTLYGGANGDAWITLYVYPANIDLASETRNVVFSLVERMGGKPTAAPAGLAPRPPGAVDNWYLGSVEGVPVLTGFRLVQHGPWFIKARITIPVSGGDEAIARAMRGIAAIPWTVPASPAASPKS